jgi:hypothetical protein
MKFSANDIDPVNAALGRRPYWAFAECRAGLCQASNVRHLCILGPQHIFGQLILAYVDDDNVNFLLRVLPGHGTLIFGKVGLSAATLIYTDAVSK